MIDVIKCVMYELRFFESYNHRIYIQYQFHRSIFPVLTRIPGTLLLMEQVMM